MKPDIISQTIPEPRCHISSYVEGLLLILIILAASLPPALVVADRWLGIIHPHILSSIWCRSDFLCKSMVPSYFLIIIGCTILLPILFIFLRNKTGVVIEKDTPRETLTSTDMAQARIGLAYQVVSIGFMLFFAAQSFFNQELPGWGMLYAWLGLITGALLSHVPIKPAIRWWEISGAKWMAILLAHGGLIGLLIGIYGKPDLVWAAVAMALLTGANLWRFRRDVPGIFWVMSLALVVFSMDINSWMTSVVGDEFSFHETAYRMSDILDYQELGKIIFRADGAHTSHTYVSSLLQVISMKFLGSENFGWRLSNPYQCSLAVGLFYYFCSTFISKKQSLVTAFLFSISSYIMAFSKIGYNNLQALFALTFVLATAAWIIRSGSRLSYVVLAYGLAYCFYAYPAALYAIPLPLILLIMYRPPRDMPTIKNWLWMISICLLMISPLLTQSEYWASKLTGTTLNQPSIFGSLVSVVTHFGSNFLFAFYSFLYTFAESHFIAASYVDPLTAVFFLIGICVAVFQSRGQRFPLFILFVYVYFLLVIGTSHDRQYPPHTRMFMIIPIYALIGMWGLCWLRDQFLQHWSIPGSISRILQISLAMLLIGLNLYQAYPLSQQRYANNQSIEMLFVRISQNIERIEPRQPKNYMIIADENWGVTGFLMIQKAYPHLAWAEMHEIQLSEPELPATSIPLLSERNTVIILMPWMEPEWVRKLETQIRDLDKVPCEVTMFGGSRLTTMFLSPDMSWACIR